MELSEARTIVRTLAQGVHPITGEAFAADSPYNHPDVIRALFTVHAHARDRRGRVDVEEKRQLNVERGLPRNTGLLWTEEDRARVASGFKDGQTIEQLATALERSRTAIHAELIRQGLVEPIGTG
jgi:predicted transcriptional regulator